MYACTEHIGDLFSLLGRINGSLCEQACHYPVLILLKCWAMTDVCTLMKISRDTFTNLRVFDFLRCGEMCGKSDFICC